MSGSKSMIAPCGINCGECEIRLAPDNPGTAEKVAKWIRENHDSECTADMIHCAGCPGDRQRDDHWAPDCWILQCCVDKNGFRYCFECSEFPCEKLEEWAGQCDRYGDALKNLWSISTAEE